MANEQVPRDNVAEITIGGKTYELEASLGTSIVYSNEFRGELDAPYKGILADDMLQAYNANQPTVTDTVKVNEGGEPVKDDGGRYVHDADGMKLTYDNPDYVGVDVAALLRIMWAMARAAGSTKKSYAKFYDEVIHQPAGLFEEASLYEVVIMRLGGGVIFRRPEGLGGAEEPDET